MRIDARFGDAPEKLLPDEGQYGVTVRSKEVGTAKSGRSTIGCWLTIEAGDGEEYEDVYHCMVFPTDADWDDDPDKARLMLRGCQRFLAMLGIDFDEKGFDEEELDGASGRCLIKIEPYEGEDRPKLSLPRIA
jgi:hypothetical protein